MSQLSPITSREYKLILNSSRFKQREEGCNQFWDLVEFLIKSNQGDIDPGKSSDAWITEERKTWYLDTPSLSLSSEGFFLRVREEEGKYKIALKYRSGDRYLSAAQDVSSTSVKDKPKFEEDIIPPFSSKFSRSNSVELPSLPELSKMSHVVDIFPGLSKFKDSIPALTPIKRVNDFMAHEICLKTPKRIKFAGISPKVKACFSFWYLLGNADEYPLITEFSFDYDVPEDKPSEFPSIEVIQGANRFFNNLQKISDWLTSSNSTKTAFAIGL
ncbi:hypothetical protein [Pseudanabaena sp. PCC 6802]|uniref:hypothetical protein n=1 Tax=Pseudanabaena sp. PCC 6802 TaxID=118173 RepID=UPI0003449E50|nr:hypothetical protein [Pseudanabaena sp. PCC 6802]